MSVEADPTDTVSVIKDKIEAEQGHPVASQKIIFSGKVLSDDKTIQSCEIKEKDFLVLMVSKPKSTPAASTSASAAPPASVPSPPKPVEPTSEAPVPAAPSEKTPAAESSATPASTPSATSPAEAPPSQEQVPALGTSFLSGDALQTTIRNMEEMGFPRDQVMRALRASYNNPDRAVEYLFNGIPAHIEAELSAPAAPPAPRVPAPNPPSVNPLASPPAVSPSVVAHPQPSGPQNLFQLAQQQQQPTTHSNLGAPPAAPGLDALRADPRFNAIRELVAQNPNLLQPVIQQLAASNPQLAQSLATNPESILDLLNDPGVGEEGDPIPPGAHVINVTPEERAAIERLEALGFPRHAVIEAYFACGKNEELAANFLFEGGFEDDPLP
ncbi:XPC-binding domain-containing protein [Russula earlei]|uniref:XPC-binding domain-containing protein n=1 Tax=Russula earlei TaxID=71964 RepID=A0ACC0TW12_9AGAM|nr:XPC-binding domain-containing protein [Russula earlei]